MSEKGLLVIGKLLRKAETTDSREEADALMAKAQELATRYSIDLAVARHAGAQDAQRELVEEREVVLGRPGQKHLKVLSSLFVQLAHLNDCSVLHRGGDASVYPVGFGSDLDTVEALYRSLAAQMAAAADDWLATGEHRQTEVLVRSGSRVVARPTHSTTARGMFYAAYIERVVARLTTAHDQAMDEALREAGSSSSGRDAASGAELSSTALALRAKEREVDDFLATAYPRLGRRTVRPTRRGGQGARVASAAGRAAADRAQLRGQRSVGPA